MKQVLKISDSLTLPLDAVTQTFAIVAKKRVGKSYTGAVIAEELIANDIPFVVLDPTGAWWGLKVDPNGKPMNDVIIIGGRNGDIPMDVGAGKIIADLVVDKPGFYILDFSQIKRKEDMCRFAADFAEHFYFRKEEKRFPMHIFCDEADIFIPQTPKFHQATRALQEFDNIVRRGGLFGIGFTMITQRPAVVNKDALSQIECLIVLRISAGIDQKAIDDHWIKQHATNEQRVTLLTSLASLTIGETWIWSPSWLEILKRVRIRKRHTLNSSATPEIGKTSKIVRLQKSDVTGLTAEIQALVQQAKENDPEHLRNEIARLSAEKSEAEAALAREQANPTKQPEPVEVPIFDDDCKAAIEKLTNRIADLNAEVLRNQQTALDIATRCQAVVTDHDALKGLIARIEAKPAPLPLLPVESSFGFAPRRQTRTGPPSYQPQADPAATSKKEINSWHDLKSGQRKFLGVLFNRSTRTTARNQLAAFAGLSSKSSHTDNLITSLRTTGLVEGGSDNLKITQRGIAIATGNVEPMPRGDRLIDYWADELGSGPGKMLRVIRQIYPNTITRDDLAQRAGLSPESSHTDNCITALRTRELIEGNGKAIKLSAWLLER